MSPAVNRIFISYRRDDAAGHAGRLEESLERRLGRGSVFRDVLDIPPGEDFVQAIRARLAGAAAVLVLIGPRWAGEDAAGRRRIDQPDDLVRLEVAVALEGRARVVPVLLPGGAMPAEAELPTPLQALARRNALALSDAHWDADVERLAAALGWARRRSLLPWGAGVLVLAAGAAGGWALLQGRRGPLSAIASSAPEPAPAWEGAWQAEVTYGWGDSYRERFEFKPHAGQLTGTATFLTRPLPAEALQADGRSLHFVTHSRQSMGSETREVTHHYAMEMRGTADDPVLAVRMHTTGAFEVLPPLEFVARRAAGAVTRAASAAAP